MNRIISLLLISFGLISASAAQPVPVTLAWGYTNAAPDSFQLLQSTNAAQPVASWPVLTNVPGTNLSVTLPILPGVNFFTVTASNFWGVSPISNVVTTPPVAVLPQNLKITR